MIIEDRNDTELYTDAVAALTRAALERNVDGTPCDFGDFLAQVLAATAANVGGPDCLIAGRPGSWESAYVDLLVRGTMGDLPEHWTWFRTQPIVIHLNVAELIEDGLHHPGLMGLDEALENLGKRYESADTEQDLDAWDSEIETVTDRYATEYRLYAERFTARRTEHRQRHPRSVRRRHRRGRHRPEQHLVVEPTATNNPSQSDSDQLAFEIWHAAHDVTPLPNVDLWLGGGRGSDAAENALATGGTDVSPLSARCQAPLSQADDLRGQRNVWSCTTPPRIGYRCCS